MFSPFLSSNHHKPYAQFGSKVPFTSGGRLLHGTLLVVNTVGRRVHILKKKQSFKRGLNWGLIQQGYSKYLPLL